MWNVGLAGVAFTALIVSVPAIAQTSAAAGAPPVQASKKTEATNVRPAYGYQLPPEWMSDEHAVDHRRYGLDRPARGFGWSRYYDDFVLSDQWGRVYDVADDYGRDGDYRRRDTDGLAGGIAGGAVGAIAGNVIAGAGSRLAGSLIGGGVGALAGLAIERAISRNRQHREHYDDRRGYYGGGHWTYGRGRQYAEQALSNPACGCETVTTTTVTYHDGASHLVPREVVTYENVYAPERTKYRARATAPMPEGKTRVRTRLHTKTY